MAPSTKRILTCVCAIALAGCAHRSSGSSSAAQGGGGSSGASSSGGGQAQPAPAQADEFEVFKVKGPKKRVGIVDFEDASGRGYGQKLAAVARDVITEGMVKSGAFVVVEREQLANVLKEQGLAMTGALSAASAAKASKLLGLQALVTGKITDYAEDVKSGGFGGYYHSTTRTAVARVSVRLVDATTGEIWLAESGEGKADSTSKSVMGGGQNNFDQTIGKKALYGAIKQLMGKIVAKADTKPWSGTVVKASKESVYITAGSDTNLPVGASLKVRRLGEEIKDPGTGVVIGRELGKVLGTLQVSQHVNEKLTMCVATKGSGFQVGDEVTADETPAPQ
jgi:curli biogenesis system outer membrane secretion channel CsgG